MPLVKFFAKRLLGVVVIVLVVSFLVFSLLALSPGSIVTTLIGTQPSTPEVVAGIKAKYHLDDPFLVQYWDWLVRALHGDFGQSVQSGQNVTSVIGNHLPVTLELAAYALVFVVVIGIPAGMLAGMRWGSVVDKGLSGLSILGMSAPGFAIGIILIYLFGVRFSIFPTFGAGDGSFVSRIDHLTLPAVTLAIGLTALIMRQTRAATLTVMKQDYITFARARGVHPIRILIRYALRNTALPIVTAGGLLLITAISGAVLIETVFSLEGEGQLMVTSISAKDVPVVQGLAFFVALFVVVLNVIVDALALIIDPRTRVAAKS